MNEAFLRKANEILLIGAGAWVFVEAVVKAVALVLVLAKEAVSLDEVWARAWTPDYRPIVDGLAVVLAILVLLAAITLVAATLDKKTNPHLLPFFLDVTILMTLIGAIRTTHPETPESFFAPTLPWTLLCLGQVALCLRIWRTRPSSLPVDEKRRYRLFRQVVGAGSLYCALFALAMRFLADPRFDALYTIRLLSFLVAAGICVSLLAFAINRRTGRFTLFYAPLVIFDAVGFFCILQYLFHREAFVELVIRWRFVFPLSITYVVFSFLAFLVGCYVQDAESIMSSARTWLQNRLSPLLAPQGGNP